MAKKKKNVFHFLKCCLKTLLKLGVWLSNRGYGNGQLYRLYVNISRVFIWVYACIHMQTICSLFL
jgi:hypothetical protein